jgi:hypothetical protein
MARQQAAATSWALSFHFKDFKEHRSSCHRAIAQGLSSTAVGLVGIEPTFTGVRDRYIPLSATVPELKTGSGPVFAPSRSTVGPVGIEPTPDGLKVSHAACYTTTPNRKVAQAFMSMRWSQHRFLLKNNSSIDLTITTSRVVRTRTEILLLPEQAMLPLAPLPDFKKSERQDSNLRSPGPRPGAMTKLRYVLSLSTHPRRSGLGGARTLVCGSSGHRYTISATSPKSKTGSGPVFAPIRKKPAVC